MSEVAFGWYIRSSPSRNPRKISDDKLTCLKTLYKEERLRINKVIKLKAITVSIIFGTIQNFDTPGCHCTGRNAA